MAFPTVVVSALIVEGVATRVSKALFASCTVIVCAGLVHGQNTDCLERTLIANVTERGVQPKDLTQDNFQIIYHGHHISPHNVYYSEGPRRLMVLLDSSGSMHGTQGNPAKWKIARLTAWSVVTALQPKSKVGLMTFSTKAEIQVPLSTDREPTIAWLDREGTRRTDMLKGRTALYDAIQLGLGPLQPHEAGDAIYVITDGGENASQIARAKVQRALRESGVRLFALILPLNPPYGEEELYGSRELVSMSHDSGGSDESVDAVRLAREVDEELKKQLRIYSERMAQQISGFYALSVELPDNPQKPRHWEVAVIHSVRNRKDVWVGYPHDVLPCQSRMARE
ncbi:MAG TPA: VWA domain-containing protein [Candidatus Binatia bacterium]|nr:VWA domain-containing protein [Candidatus Binatia bacterium]